MEECGLINMGARIATKFTVEYPIFKDFKNDNLALVISGKVDKSCEVKYKPYSITQVGKSLLKIADIETANNFFIEMAKILKDKLSALSIRILLFDIDNAISYETSYDIDWNKNLILN